MGLELPLLIGPKQGGGWICGSYNSYNDEVLDERRQLTMTGGHQGSQDALKAYINEVFDSQYSTVPVCTFNEVMMHSLHPPGAQQPDALNSV